jgi:hypothetical protein
VPTASAGLGRLIRARDEHVGEQPLAFLLADERDAARPGTILLGKGNDQFLAVVAGFRCAGHVAAGDRGRRVVPHEPDIEGVRLVEDAAEGGRDDRRTEVGLGDTRRAFRQLRRCDRLVRPYLNQGEGGFGLERTAGASEDPRRERLPCDGAATNRRSRG